MQDDQQTQPAKRGSAGRGQGRKSLADGAGASKTINLRVTDEQRKKYDERGGAEWLRKLIDAA